MSCISLDIEMQRPCVGCLVLLNDIFILVTGQVRTVPETREGRNHLKTYNHRIRAQTTLNMRKRRLQYNIRSKMQ